MFQNGVEMELLLQQNVDSVLILVSFSASPGRLVDHLENTKGFNLKALKYLVRCFPTLENEMCFLHFLL